MILKAIYKGKRILKWCKKLVIWTMLLGLISSLCVVALSEGIQASTEDSVYAIDEANELKADCILVLGCGIRQDGTPGTMLTERLDTGIAAYFMGVSDRLLMSGDHGRENYDEVNAMKNYAMSKGVPSEHIFMDHAGFSTYESMYRAKDIFKCEKVVVVTQEYHLYRGIYNARAMGMEATGIKAQRIIYRDQWFYDLRETVARAKDFVFCTVKPKPTYLGEPIPILGDGNATNDYT